MVPPLAPPPASQTVKPKGLWSRPSVPWAKGVPAELAGPDDQRLVEQAAALEVGEQAGDRLVDGAGVGLVVLPQIAVGVPGVGVAGVDGDGQLDEPHAALDQPAGEQAVLGVRRGSRGSAESMP